MLLCLLCPTNSCLREGPIIATVCITTYVCYWMSTQAPRQSLAGLCLHICQHNRGHDSQEQAPISDADQLLLRFQVLSLRQSGTLSATHLPALAETVLDAVERTVNGPGHRFANRGFAHVGSCMHKGNNASTLSLPQGGPRDPGVAAACQPGRSGHEQGLQAAGPGEVALEEPCALPTDLCLS